MRVFDWWLGIGSSDCYENCMYGLVDVRDVAEAHILTYETPASSSQRYLCCNVVLDKSAIVGMLRNLYPDHLLPQRFYFPKGLACQHQCYL